MQGFIVPDSDRIETPQGGGPRIRQVIPPAPEKPRLPSPQTPAQARKDELEVKKLEAELAKKETVGTPKDAIAEITNVIDKAKQARRKSLDWFATGVGSNIARAFGGTPAADVQGLLDTVGANTAFEQLQKMRAESPTGGALGNVTERELDLLKSTIASLSPDQSDKQFQKSMLDIIKSYGRVLMKLPGGREEAIRRGWAAGKSPAAQPKQPGGEIKFLGFE